MIRTIYTFFMDNFKELFLYGMIGGGAVLIDIGLYFVFLRIGGSAESKSLVYDISANALSTAIAVVYSFTLNSIFTFKVKDKLLKRFFSFAAISCIGLIVSSIIIIALQGVGVPADVAKVIGLPFVFIVQFTLNRLTTFGDYEDHSDDNILELAIEEGDLV